MMHTAESDFTVECMHSAHSEFLKQLDYLGKIEIENSFNFLSGVQVGSNPEKIKVANLVIHSFADSNKLFEFVFLSINK